MFINVLVFLNKYWKSGIKMYYCYVLCWILCFLFAIIEHFKFFAPIFWLKANF